MNRSDMQARRGIRAPVHAGEHAPQRADRVSENGHACPYRQRWPSF